MEQEKEDLLKKYKRKIIRRNILIVILIILIILLLLRCRCKKWICDCNNWDILEFGQNPNIKPEQKPEEVPEQKPQEDKNNQNNDKENNKPIKEQENSSEKNENEENSSTPEIKPNDKEDTNEDEKNDDTPEEEEIPTEEIKVTAGTLIWGKNTKLNIFGNKELGGKHIIWPNQEGKYKFKVENGTNYNIKYTIKFKEQRSSELNLMYKLKIGEEYLVNQWTYADQIEIIKDLDSKKDAEYTLEWKWVEQTDELDTSAESTKYKLEISIDAEQII